MGKRRQYHLVYRLNNLQHLVIANLAVPVNIVQLKRPIELVLHLATARNAQGADELLKVDGARFITVEDVEDVVCKGTWIAEGEELAVDLLELFFGEEAGGAVLEEAWEVLDMLVA